MQYRSRIRNAFSAMDFNATALIDCIFLLTIFFVLVARFSAAEYVPIHVPDPVKSKAVTDESPNRIVLNASPSDERQPQLGAVFQMGANAPEPLSVLADRLVAVRKERGVGMKVVVRADRRLNYRDVHQLLEVVAAAGFDSVDVAARTGEGEGP